jgi:hypothetical protein
MARPPAARGAAGGSAVHLLAAFDQASGVVLGQTAVDSKSNEVTAFAPLLDRLDLDNVLVTADALHTHRGHTADTPSICTPAAGTTCGS